MPFLSTKIFLLLVPMIVAVSARCVRFHTVYGNDICYDIWNKYGLSENQFYSLNSGIDCDDLQEGQKICIGSSSSSSSSNKPKNKETTPSSTSVSPSPPYGQLKISGKYVTNSNGTPIQLRGMSLFWSQWEEGSPFYNSKTVQNVKKFWNSNVIRASMAVEEGGYLTQPKVEYEKIIRVIDAAIEEGIYVIIDWHDHRAHKHREQAQQFFDKISKTYGSYPNIIYEIWNEPNDDEDVTWSVIKSYAERVIEVIRKNDQKNIIVVGTAFWAQDVDVAAEDPIDDGKNNNIAYTLHFYAGSHKQDIREKVQKAIDKNLPIFVTEYGTVNADGDGPVNEKETKKWWKFLDENKISYVNWSMENKAEGCAALKPDSGPDDIENESKWTKSGKFVNQKLQSTNQGVK